MSILSGIANTLGNVIKTVVIPGFGNVTVDMKRFGALTRNPANEAVSAWDDIASTVAMRIDVLTADAVAKTWGETSTATATALAAGDVDVKANDVLLVRTVLEGVFPTNRWKVEEALYNDAARMWTLALSPHKGALPT